MYKRTNTPYPSELLNRFFYNQNCTFAQYFNIDTSHLKPKPINQVDKNFLMNFEINDREGNPKIQYKKTDICVFYIVEFLIFLCILGLLIEKINGKYQIDYLNNAAGINGLIFFALCWIAYPYCILCNKDILTKNEWIILRPSCYIKIPLIELETIFKNDFGTGNNYVEINGRSVCFNIRDRKIKIDCYQPGAYSFIYKLFQSVNVPLPKNFIKLQIPEIECTVGQYYNIVQDEVDENQIARTKVKTKKRKKH